MKIQKMISLDQETARLASQKTNFSDWVRCQLRSERNKREGGDFSSLRFEQRLKVEEHLDLSTSELLYHLERKSDEEIKILVQILKNSIQEV
jgi:hypothetical protein